jgi:plasmid stabilization system protein ParE
MPDRYAIEWTAVAEADVDEILEYITSRDCVEAALAVYEKLMNRIETLASRPTRCRLPPELRKLGVSEYRELIISPYGVFFRVRGKRVGIVAVLDRRRDLEELLVQRALRAGN